MKKKKIIQVVPSFNVGGAEALVKEYLINLHKNGHEVEAFCLGARKETPFTRELDAAGVRVIYLPELYSVNEKLPSGIKHIVTAFKWRRAVKKHFQAAIPDVVHCHLCVARSIVCAKKQLKKARLFYTVHSEPDKFWENGKNSDELSAINTLISQNDMQMIALHKDAIESLRKYVGEKSKIHVLNNAIDFSKYRCGSKSAESVRKEIGINPDDFVVGHVGRFCKPKNHQFIVEVFSDVAKRNDKARLVLVGDGELRKEIEALVSEKNLLDKVRFLGNRSDIPNLLHSFDAFLFPSLWEGFPITLIEAQAAGVPCVISDVITDDVKLTNLVKKISLDEPTSTWATELISWTKGEIESYGLDKYNIETVLVTLLKIYD